MFFMQNKGRGKAAKVVNFVAKWLNLCLSMVLRPDDSKEETDGRRKYNFFSLNELQSTLPTEFKIKYKQICTQASYILTFDFIP